jgi:hypothetical protein
MGRPIVEQVTFAVILAAEPSQKSLQSTELKTKPKNKMSYYKSEQKGHISLRICPRFYFLLLNLLAYKGLANS